MGHIRKILVPMDGSPPSMAALSQAVSLAEDLGATIEVLHVAEKPGEPGERDMDEAIDAAGSRLGNRLSRRIEAGDPTRKILEIAATEDTDLIVMGTHGRVGRLRALVGSVAEGVVRSSSCPVLTVRVRDGQDESFAERIHRRETIADRARHPR